MSDLQVQRIHPSEWALYRDLREAAVTETPAVFASSRIHEAERCPQQWQDLLRDGYTVAARLDGRCVGFATAHTPPGAVGSDLRAVHGWAGPVPGGPGQSGPGQSGPGPGGPGWTATLAEVWVDPAVRGRRLPGPDGPTAADVMVLVLCGWARHRSRTWMSTVVPREAPAMRRLAERHGFTATGRRRALRGPVPRLGDVLACDLAVFDRQPSPRSRLTLARSS